MVGTLGRVTSFERPAPDADKIVAAWQAWIGRDDDVLPGRTMADLKTAGVDRLLDALAEDNESVGALAEAWQAWERGRVGPEDTLGALDQGGFQDIAEALAETS